MDITAEVACNTAMMLAVTLKGSMSDEWCVLSEGSRCEEARLEYEVGQQTVSG